MEFHFTSMFPLYGLVAYSVWYMVYGVWYLAFVLCDLYLNGEKDILNSHRFISIARQQQHQLL